MRFHASWDVGCASRVQVARIRTSVFLSMKYEIPEMLAVGGGAIVNNSSIYGLVGSTVGHVPYAASKYGVIGITHTAAYEYAKQGIRVNAVCPGYTRTELMQVHCGGKNTERIQQTVLPRIPMRRLGEMTEIARPEFRATMTTRSLRMNVTELPLYRLTGGGRALVVGRLTGLAGGSGRASQRPDS